MKHNPHPWTLKQIEDRLRKYGDGYYPGTCEQCGKRGLRIVHFISRDDPEEVKRVGACCAPNLVKGYDAIGQQRKMKNQYARVSRIPHRKGWYESQSGNQTIVIEGWRIIVYLDTKIRSQFRFMVVRDDEKHYSPDFYKSESEAKSAAGWKLADLAGWFDADDLLDEKRDVPEDENDDD